MIDENEDETPKELSEAQKEAIRLIAEKKKQANALVNECIALADEHNISFHIGMINHYNTYIPTENCLDEYGEETSPYDGYEGWQQSGC